jgi:hypothetical protein
MSWIMMLIYLYIVFTTSKYALSVWHENNKFASIFITFMAAGLLILPIYILFYL